MFRITVSSMVAVIITILCLTSSVRAETENRYDSESIGVFEYIGYEHKNWANPVKAKFRPIKVLKGPRFGRDLAIRYESHSKNLKCKMPLRGSIWILFIPVALPKNGMFETFNGSDGRIIWSDETQQKILTEAVHDRCDQQTPCFPSTPDDPGGKCAMAKWLLQKAIDCLALREAMDKDYPDTSHESSKLSEVRSEISSHFDLHNLCTLKLFIFVEIFADTSL